MGCILSTLVEIHFLSSLEWFGQHKLKYIFSPHLHGIRFFYTRKETFCALAGMGEFCSTQVVIQFASSLACLAIGNTCWVILSVFSVMGRIWSTQFHMRFVSSLQRHRFSQHKFRYIFCPCDMRGVLSTNVEIHFVSSLAGIGIGQHILRYISVFAGIVLSSYVEIHFESSLVWEKYGQHK